MSRPSHRWLSPLALLALAAGCGGDQQAGETDPLPTVTFSIARSSCKLGMLPGQCDAERAEIYLVRLDTGTPCILHKLEVSAEGASQTAEGVQVEPGQRYEVFVLLYCPGEKDCPACFGQEQVTVEDQARVEVKMTPIPKVGDLCPAQQLAMLPSLECS